MAARAKSICRNIWQSTKQAVKDLNFIQIHYLYFLGTSLLSAIIFWAASTPFRSVSFVDSLFLCVSAMTLAGLNTVNLSLLSTFQQAMLFILIIMGSAIFVSAFVVHVRRRAFEDRFVTEIDLERRRGLRRSLQRSISRVRSSSRVRMKDRNGASGRFNGSTTAVSANGDAHPKQQDSAPAVDEHPTPQSSYQQLSDPMEDQPALVSRQTTQPDTGGLPDATNESSSPADIADAQASGYQSAHIAFSLETRSPRAPFSSVQSVDHGHHVLSHVVPRAGIGAIPHRPSRSISNRSGVLVRPRSYESQGNDEEPSMHHRPLKSGVLARNSTFHHMSEDDRERLGGLEYKAVRFLNYLVPLYFILWQLLGALGLGAYVHINRPTVARDNGLNPFWVGAFNAISAFNNSGMSLLDANMVAFQTAIYMLLTMSLLILAGNTCYPVFLRLICWTIWRLLCFFSDNDWLCGHRETLRFLLDHPRRVYTNMFPSRETWWLLTTVVVLNGIDCACFSILNIGNDAITKLSPGIEFIDGLFQAFAVRSGGFYVVPITSTRISLQFLYVVMMYIGVYPVVITIRNSNVYEERSLGIYTDDPGYIDYEKQHKQQWSKILATLMGHGGSSSAVLESVKSNFIPKHGMHQKANFVQQQLRAQLAHDLWWLVLAVWLITIIEGGQFEKDPADFSVFNIIFEVVSGYATVGISVGVPWDAYSFCGAWHTLSKLVLIAVMIRGRHRGLPVAIDKAIRLPNSTEDAGMEEEDARFRWTMSRGTGVAEEEII